ncbi:hypothetical protein FQA39_LY15853 [Lamprigera yunnana]|nr:hypothetical protein FQA39_LY15853 [Lamprigera yunnana]
MLKLILLLLIATLVGAIKPRIVGGEDADVEDFPHQISIEYEGIHRCGGSVLDTTRVLTAAHCVHGATPEEVIIRVGTSISEQGGHTRNVSRFIIHPDYVELIQLNDVAVIILSSPLVLSTTIAAVSLTTGEEVAVGTRGTVTGWGVSNTNTNILQKLDVPRLSNDRCGYPFFNATIMECYGAEEGQSACLYDSGGALIVSGVQVGIVSVGYSICGAAQPTIYTKVSYFLQFINNAN